MQLIERVQSLLAMRNVLSHGTIVVRAPGTALIVQESCGCVTAIAAAKVKPRFHGSANFLEEQGQCCD